MNLPVFGVIEQTLDSITAVDLYRNKEQAIEHFNRFCKENGLEPDALDATVPRTIAVACSDDGEYAICVIERNIV